ncbi:MAG TPA: phospho-N-acetylmuramoyl-pentapeptide-transferase [Verrucomicrobiales bacterium]|nr:phospho-N-acetylmuramoyl-pentapeptide-transferase [Verrucomicrobiales bacterium]
MFYYLHLYITELATGTEWEWLASAVNMFRYVTVRAAGAAVTALLLSLWWGPGMIRWLKNLKFGQDYSDKAEEGGDLKARVLSKKGTPTMGGIMLVLIMDLTALLWAQWNTLVQLTLLSVLVLAGLGFYDDYAKITKQTSAGAAEYVKLVVQFGLALFIGIYLWQLPATRHLVSDIMVPFYKYPVLTGAAWLGIPITVFAIVGSSNAVNLTDGLDGLAVGLTVIVGLVFAVLTYVAGNKVFADYLFIPHAPGAGELTVFCAAMLGAGLGFLWFNCHPAQMFMGDTGSLALGGALGIMAVLIHQPLVLVIAGGVFVMEAASVLIQRFYFKYTRRRFGQGRRVFLMAPLHHHYEKLGWYESQVVTRFYILGILFGLLALSTLKIR